jgi:uncharacterized protein YegL
MKQDLTEIVAILDCSGSMILLTDETISGYNAFIDEQKKAPGEAKLTTVIFNSAIEKLYDRVDIQKVKPLTEKEYHAQGMTALLDAIGQSVDDLGKKLAATPEEERPSKVVVMILTDGEENSSNRYSHERIKEMIDIQRNTYSWEFIFLAKDIQTVDYAQSMGISNSMMYCASPIGTQTAYRSLSKSIMGFRGGKGIDAEELKKDLQEET